VGALALGACCERLERAAKSGDAAQSAASLLALQAALVDVVARLSEDPARARSVSTAPSAGGAPQALAQTRRWRDSGLALHVGLNVAMDNLSRLDFAEFAFDELARQGVPAGALVLEVTESQLAGDRRTAMDVLTRLRLRNVGPSIDDFGTGYSSLAQFREMPFGS
jgi:hypothetical protein